MEEGTSDGGVLGLVPQEEVFQDPDHLKSVKESPPTINPKANRFWIILSLILQFIHSRSFRKFMYWVSTAALGVFVLLSKLALTQVMKYFVASATIPIELMMLYTQLRKMYDKQSSWLEIGAIAVLGFVPIVFYVFYDLYNFGSTNPAVAIAVNIMAPVFAGLMMAMAVYNTVKLVGGLVNYYKDKTHPDGPLPMSPMENFRLYNKFIKTIGTIIIAALIIPATTFPFLTIPLFVVMAVAFTAIAVSKVAKRIYERNAWNKTILYLPNDEITDPYLKLLGSPEKVEEFKARVENEKLLKNKVKFLDKIKKTFTKGETIDKESVQMLKTALRQKPHLVGVYDLLRNRRGRERYDEYKNPPEPGFFEKLVVKIKIKFVRENTVEFTPLAKMQKPTDIDAGLMPEASGDVFSGGKVSRTVVPAVQSYKTIPNVARNPGKQ